MSEWHPETNEIPFGLLSPLKQELMKACRHGHLVYTVRDTWVRCQNPRWSPNAVYRALPKPKIKPRLDWRGIDPRWKWLAKDKNGSLWLYEKKPERKDECWTSSSHEFCWRIDTYLIAIQGNCDWDDSLVERPTDDSN